jgi:hypothetical protein
MGEENVLRLSWDNQKIDMLQANTVRLEKSVKNEILRQLGH